MMKMYGIKAYFYRIIVVCDRAHFETIYLKRDICRSVFLLFDFTGVLPADWPLRYQIRTICKVMWMWKSDTQFWFLHQFYAISLKSSWDHWVERVSKNILMTCLAGHTTSWVVSWAGFCWAANFQSGVVEGRKSFCLKCIKNIQYNLFPYLVGI